MHQEHQSCIDACDACATACEHCAASCLREQDVADMVGCIAQDIDCAQICRLAAALMARGSEHMAAVCRLCADACRRCAEECGQHPMEHCQQCAAACRLCAEECSKMAA